MWKAVTSALGLFFLGWIAPHYAPGLADAISARIHPDPIEWSLENLGSGSVVLPRPVSDPRSLPSGEEKAADLTSRLYAQGAADADTNHIVLTAKVARDASVVFKRLVIRKVERRPALRTPELAPYFRAIAVAAGGPRVGDGSAGYNLAVPAQDGRPSQGPRHLLAVSRGWFLVATSQKGAKATLDQVLPGVLRHLDTELGTRFSAPSRSVRPPPSCPAVSPRLSDGSPLAIRDLAAVVTVHNLACGGDGGSLSGQMTDPFASDRGLLRPARVVAAWKDKAVRRGQLRLLASTLEQPGQATEDGITFRLGNAAVAFTRIPDPDPMHDTLRWSAFVARCAQARPGIRNWCHTGPGDEDAGRRAARAGALGSQEGGGQVPRLPSRRPERGRPPFRAGLLHLERQPVRPGPEEGDLTNLRDRTRPGRATVV